MPTCPTCGGWFARQDLLAASSDADAPRDRCPHDGTVVLVGSSSPETRAAMEAKRARALHDISWTDIGGWLAAIVLAPVAGLALLVVFAIVGRSLLAAIVGTIAGVVVGVVLVPILLFGAYRLASMLVSLRGDNQGVREAGRAAFTWITVGVFVLPVLSTVVVSLALS